MRISLNNWSENQTYEFGHGDLHLEYEGGEKNICIF